MSTRRTVWLLTVCVALAGVVVSGHSDKSGRALTVEDLHWLNRVTFGVDSATVARYREVGRVHFLDEQLHASVDDAPAIAAEIESLPISRETAEQLVKAIRAEQQRIAQLKDPDEQQRARMALNQRGNQMTYETTRRHLVRALYSPTQLREQMTWFWMNHFSVFSGKANVRFTLAEYENKAVRPHALGRFRDLVLATLESPAMLEYLDNAQSAGGRINENYARELMELHTLGVSGGASGSRYSQQDVQELARVLTGIGINATDDTPRLPPAKREWYVRRGLFEFNPNRHDFEPKVVLRETIRGDGLSEAEKAVTLLCRQPATARFVSTKLATYFAADQPPPRLIEAMTQTFTRSDGDIAAVLRTMFLSPDFLGLLDGRHATPKFKDPVQFVVSSLRMGYDDKMISNYHPIVNWLAQLGEPMYGRVTPDGYPLVEAAWASSGQLVKRFEIARAVGGGGAGLFNPEEGAPAGRQGFPQLANRLYFEAVETTLSRQTKAALAQAASQQEWNTLLLSSPEWMQR
jgi:uncharacterized protein (DUF1800 family)